MLCDGESLSCGIVASWLALCALRSRAPKASSIVRRRASSPSRSLSHFSRARSPLHLAMMTRRKRLLARNGLPRRMQNPVLVLYCTRNTYSPNIPRTSRPDQRDFRNRQTNNVHQLTRRKQASPAHSHATFRSSSVKNPSATTPPSNPTPKRGIPVTKKPLPSPNPTLKIPKKIHLRPESNPPQARIKARAWQRRSARRKGTRFPTSLPPPSTLLFSLPLSLPLAPRRADWVAQPVRRAMRRPLSPSSWISHCRW